MTIAEEYYYNKQLRSYVVQFAAIFQSLQVEVGKRDDVESHLIRVPVKVASSDRVVAAIKNDNTQNKPIRLPLTSAQLVNVDMAPDLRHGVAGQRRNTFVPTGGLLPDDISVVAQRMPVPYRAMFELTIWASNQDQHYQIMEQILSVFDPTLQIQTSDDVFDWAKITTVELMGIQFNENVPAGADRRLIQSTLTFSAPIYMSLPANVHQRFVNEIKMRVGAVSGSLDDTYEILTSFDLDDIPYETIITSSDIPVV